MKGQTSRHRFTSRRALLASRPSVVLCQSSVVPVAALLSLLLAHAAAAKTDYKKWLQEEVVWIISQKERARFAALTSNGQREAFIREFWQRRDPTPSTPRNEYKEEHYRRYAHALKAFQEGTPGWRTDRGRIYIIHGPPDRENFVASQARLNLGGLSDIQSRMPNTIIWSYHGNPNGRYYRGELNLVFQPSTGLTRHNFALGESSTAQERAEELNRLFGPTTDQNWLEGDVRYRLVVAGPPSIINTRGADLPTAGIGESAKYIDDLFRSPGDVLEENLKKQAGVERAKREIRDAVTARLGFGSLPLHLSSRSFTRPDGAYRVHVQVDIPNSSLAAGLAGSGRDKDTSQVDIYCALVDSEGHVTDEAMETMEMSRPLLLSLPGENL
ncbi:MAG: GWxTD domain-containing protein, partial [Acidobacteria bacterium]|nr:GWxTD domain-containing protein [Acidobacteriota bacterium]